MDHGRGSGGVRIQSFVKLEIMLRALRDRFIFRPLAASRQIQRYAHSNFELVVKAFDDHKIAFDPSDKVVGHHIGKFGDWFRDDFRRVVTLLNNAGSPTREKIFMDVGANIGTQTVYALVGDDFAGSISFEPAPKNVMALKANITINDLDSRAMVVPKAVGAAPGTLTLMLDDENSGGHSFRSGTSGGKKSALAVELTTIDAALAELAVDPSDIGLLWLDVEGYEPEAIAGAKRILALRVPLCIEFNSHVYGDTGTSSLLDLLANAGYRSATAIGTSLPERTFALDDIDPNYLPGDFLFL
jgi:FkbM family methyltransferase